MALTGELSDLTLAELIEFFCNQRKTGRLKVMYAVGPGYFYLKSGAVIHAHFGDLRGIDAVFYALTQSTASFTFSSGAEPPEHSINQPWTSVVLEGLRRMDEGIEAPQPSLESLKEVPKPATAKPEPVKPAVVEATSSISSSKDEISKARSRATTEDVKAFGVLLSSSEPSSFSVSRRRPAMVVAAVVLLVAAVGVPWVVHTRQKARAANQATVGSVAAPTPAENQITPTPEETQLQTQPESQPETNSSAADLAQRQREARMRERAKLEQGAASKSDGKSDGNSDAAKPAAVSSAPASAGASSAKKATVQVTYDENGRVTAASGGDSNALRIARQKRFPPGKPGSATITIPIN